MIDSLLPNASLPAKGLYISERLKTVLILSHIEIKVL